MVGNIRIISVIVFVLFCLFVIGFTFCRDLYISDKIADLQNEQKILIDKIHSKNSDEFKEFLLKKFKE